MSEEVLENYKSLLIEVLNENIRLEEAITAEKPMGGVGGPKGAKEPDTVDNILMGSQQKALDLGPAGAVGLAAGGKLAGTLGRFAGKGAANFTSALFGGNALGQLAGSATGNLLSKVFTDVETLSGARGLEAQIGDIAPNQVALRWEGSGHGGWFNKLVPKTKVEKIKPETEQERRAARRKARKERIGDIELGQKERTYGLPPIP